MPAPMIAVVVERTIPVARPSLFAWFVPIDLSRILVGYGPLPRVVRTSDQSAPWSEVGATRRVHLADGSTATERVTTHMAPSSFGYRVGDITHSLLRRLVDHATGEWTFVDTTTRTGVRATRVTWRYTFVAHSRASAALLQPIVRLLWRGYMSGALSKLDSLAISEARAPLEPDSGATLSNDSVGPCDSYALSHGTTGWAEGTRPSPTMRHTHWGHKSLHRFGASPQY